MKTKKQKIDYKKAGVNYDSMDPIKTLAQKSAKETSINLKIHGFEEIEDTRGESAYVWKQGNTYMASVIEGLGTKNLVADATRTITNKTYYENIGHDTIAAIINDLISVGAKPLVIHAYWAVGDSKWLEDLERMKDLIKGWKSACDISGASWGGGETPTYKGIINPKTVDLGGSAVGIIANKKNLLTDKKLKIGDRILLLKSTGINVNGLSLARAIANKLSKGYATKLKNGTTYGEALLVKSNIYAKLIQDLQNEGIDIHYISNLTGHGLRKIMRARGDFSYIIEKIFEPQEIFHFLQKHAGLTDYEMYETYNMGQDYAIFLPEKDVKKTQKIVAKNGFESLDAGYIKKGERQVIIQPKNITYKGETLKVRI
jgi:phosphoribosylformylglycinamidine cyclo-ligase